MYKRQVWDDDKQEYVLTYVNNTEQRSIFESDFQDVMNQPEDGVEDAVYKEVPMLEGEVADEGALPGATADRVSLEDFHSDDTEDDGYGYEDVV